MPSERRSEMTNLESLFSDRFRVSLRRSGKGAVMTYQILSIKRTKGRVLRPPRSSVFFIISSGSSASSSAGGSWWAETLFPGVSQRWKGTRLLLVLVLRGLIVSWHRWFDRQGTQPDENANVVGYHDSHSRMMLNRFPMSRLSILDQSRLRRTIRWVGNDYVLILDSTRDHRKECAPHLHCRHYGGTVTPNKRSPKSGEFGLTNPIWIMNDEARSSHEYCERSGRYGSIGT